MYTEESQYIIFCEGQSKEIYLPYKPCCGWSHFLTGRDLSRWPFFWVSDPSSTLSGASRVCDGFVGQTLEPLLTHSKATHRKQEKAILCFVVFFLPWVVKIKWCCKASDAFLWERQLSREWGGWRQQPSLFFSPHLPLTFSSPSPHLPLTFSLLLSCTTDSQHRY